MTITITHPETKEKIVLTAFSADLGREFDESLGHDPDRYCRRKERPATWPIKFDLKATGTIESVKGALLLVSATASYKAERGKAPEFVSGFNVRLTRQSTNQEIGGWENHDRISGLLRTNASKFAAAAKAALKDAVKDALAEQASKRDAYASRHRLAHAVLASLSK